MWFARRMLFSTRFSGKFYVFLTLKFCKKQNNVETFKFYSFYPNCFEKLLTPIDILIFTMLQLLFSDNLTALDEFELTAH